MQIHFIGIGGIGISALAQYYLAKGWEVSGCDLSASETTRQLAKKGAHIRIGAPLAECVPKNAVKIVYSPAIPTNHRELLQAKNYNLQTLSYPEALGELTKEHFTIAVSGTHGKSTTTSMIGLLLAKAGFNPTVVVGTKLKEYGNSNFRMGGAPSAKHARHDARYLVIEADEYAKSFLHYTPHIMVLTTLEKDHMETYGTLRHMLATFQRYLAALPAASTIVANRDDKNVYKILTNNKKQKAQRAYYSLKQPEAKKLRGIMQVPGEHNVANALAALAVARMLNIPDRTNYAALRAYTGAWRRFEIFDVKIGNCKVKIVSDYGHHPTEVKVTVEAARSKWPKKQIWLLFQPHQYKRTYYLFKEFVDVLAHIPVQKLLLTDIYYVAGREDPNIEKKVSTEKLVRYVKKEKRTTDIVHVPNLQDAEAYLAEHLTGGEIVMVMGAGDIYSLTSRLTQEKIQ